MARQKRAKRDDGRLQKSFMYNGKRYFVYGRTNDELEENFRQKRDELESGIADRINPTLNDYYKRFTDNRRRKIKEATIRIQSYQFQDCACISIDSNGKKLGQMRMRDIKPYDVQAVQKALEESGRTTETVNNCMDHLSHVFNAAVKDETIDRNPCICIERIKRIEPPARETIHRALTEDETKRFFAAAGGCYYYNAFVVMIQTGMRVGEVGALHISDVDNFEKVIRVNKTISRDEIGGYIIGSTPKTEAGNREIPVNEMVLRCIRDQRRLNGDLFGNRVEKTIFRSPEGALMREYSINREIKRICKIAKIERFTCHAFRATFATRFIEQRPQDYKILSEILGHSNTSITLDLYTHVMKEKKFIAMNDINISIG